MAIRGRKPKPIKLRILEGNPGKRPINGKEPHPTGKMPRCPTWLDAAAKAKWKAIAGQLRRLGLLTSLDGDALAAYCQAFAEFVAATKIIQKEGRVCKTANGYLSPHPAVTMQRTAWAAMQRFAALFGMDPSSRSRLAIELPRDLGDDEFEDLLNDTTG